MTFDAFLDANRQFWDARTPLNVGSAGYRLAEFEAGRSSLNPIELDEVGAVQGKSLLHLQCHFGLDTLSWARLGAAVVGIDFSAAAIAQARALAARHAPTARFEQCSVYAARQAVPAQFDVVFTSYGVIGWLPDLARWAAVVAASLAPGGFFYMVEFHPFIWMLDDDFRQIHYDYFFTPDPIVTHQAGLAYSEYGWNHALSETLGSLLAAGLQIELFREHRYSPYRCFPGMVAAGEGQYVFEQFGSRIPYLFSLKARKP